ncbi:alpha-E domain-containing protein [Fulvivirga sediminis]|uniref:Alpha-E domain-containing protein n=1 Tax=Fulvivirga sediminis TaxID=2803949 RepID=A0A937FA71_9BACT|nr:alpha-E domain-containing protein [Fulvivirga sediminis]MBL3658535.1 alpha-E domain-containing protein [Fulvivirga sediminis]
MLSRVADSIYWLGRYLERAENYARFIDVNYNLMLDLPPGMDEQWEPLIAVTGDLEDYKKRHPTSDRKSAIFFLAFDEENPNSLLSSISRARENARVVRENLNKETWEKLNEVYLQAKQGYKAKIWQMDDPRGFFIHIKYAIQLLYGIADTTVARTEAWYFNRLGQYLERADKTSRVLDVKYHILLPAPEEVGSPLDYLHWMALLKSVSGFNTYRRAYGKIVPHGVVEFLMLDKFFPRSTFFCLTEAEECLYKISGYSGKGFSNSTEKYMGELRSKLEFADINDVINKGLHEYIDDIQIKINIISNTIHENFFMTRDNLVEQKQVNE